MKIPQICLDVDGVLVDLVSAFALLAGRDPGAVLADWVPGEYSLSKQFGIAEEEVWRLIEGAGGETFWLTLPLYPWFEELLELCHDAADSVILCTSPTLDPASASGKTRWIQHKFGRKFRNYLIGAPKHACARPGAVLIDDSEHNCEVFREHGGSAICFPRLWNQNHKHAADPMAYVRKRLVESQPVKPLHVRSGDPRFHARLESMGELHDSKQADYGTDGDPFANVRASREFGIPPWLGAILRLNDKVTRIKSFAKKGALKNEPLQDSFDDIAVYAVIARILYDEEHGCV